jgi:hypothetical protein
VENPVELVPDIPVKLGAHKAVRRRKHIVVFRVTGPGGVKKADGAFSGHIWRLFKKQMCALKFGIL